MDFGDCTSMCFPKIEQGKLFWEAKLHEIKEWDVVEHSEHQECFTFYPCKTNKALEKILSDHAAEFRAVVL